MSSKCTKSLHLFKFKLLIAHSLTLNLRLFIGHFVFLQGETKGEARAYFIDRAEMLHFGFEATTDQKYYGDVTVVRAATEIQGQIEWRLQERKDKSTEAG